MEKPPDRVPHARLPDALPVGSRADHRRLLIRVSTGSGSGPTRLAAFDSALFAAGVADYNLIRLSSVIPPHAVVREVSGLGAVQGALGDVAYCVYAAAYASTPGNRPGPARVGRSTAKRSGAGLFVEHTASSESVVRRDLTRRSQAMSQTRGNRYRIAGQTVSSAVCVDHPVCAVVVATYGTAGWSDLLNSEG